MIYKIIIVILILMTSGCTSWHSEKTREEELIAIAEENYDDVVNDIVCDLLILSRSITKDKDRVEILNLFNDYIAKNNNNVHSVYFVPANGELLSCSNKENPICNKKGHEYYTRAVEDEIFVSEPYFITSIDLDRSIAIELKDNEDTIGIIGADIHEGSMGKGGNPIIKDKDMD